MRSPVPVFSRPLKRVIQTEVETALGRRLLQGEIHDGQTVLVDYDPALGELPFVPHTSEAEGVAAR